MQNRLIELSKVIGMRTDYVQAGGGNISIKLDNEIMIIKASGYNLSDINENNGISTVNYKKLLDYMNKYEKISNKDVLKDCHISGEKPSIEMFLHAKTYKYTIHIHSLLSNILLTRVNGKDKLKELFPDSLYVTYAMPGLELAKKMTNYDKQKIIFLENHGLIISSDKYDELFELLEYVDNKLSDYLKIDYSKYSNITKIYNLIKEYNDKLIYLVEDNSILNAFKKNNYKLWNYYYFPDSIVYCGLKELALVNLTDTEIKKYLIEFGDFVIITYKNNLYISSKNLKKAREIESVLSLSAKVFLENKNQDVQYINNEDAQKLYNCDFEKYRRDII